MDGMLYIMFTIGEERKLSFVEMIMYMCVVVLYTRHSPGVAMYIHKSCREQSEASVGNSLSFSTHSLLILHVCLSLFFLIFLPHHCHLLIFIITICIGCNDIRR